MGYYIRTQSANRVVRSTDWIRWNGDSAPISSTQILISWRNPWVASFLFTSWVQRIQTVNRLNRGSQHGSTSDYFSTTRGLVSLNVGINDVCASSSLYIHKHHPKTRGWRAFSREEAHTLWADQMRGGFRLRFSKVSGKTKLPNTHTTFHDIKNNVHGITRNSWKKINACWLHLTFVQMYCAKWKP